MEKALALCPGGFWPFPRALMGVLYRTSLMGTHCRTHPRPWYGGGQGSKVIRTVPFAEFSILIQRILWDLGYAQCLAFYKKKQIKTNKQKICSLCFKFPINPPGANCFQTHQLPVMHAKLSIDSICAHKYLWDRVEAKSIRCKLSLFILHIYKVV